MQRDTRPQSDSEDDEYDEQELQIQARKLANLKATGQRSSVSAEVYGAFNKKENFKAKVVPKTAQQRNRIEAILQQAFMFSVLDDKERDTVIGAMEERKFKTGEWIINQGEEGDVLYVVDEGRLDCFKRLQKDGPATYLKTYEPGEAFGELALLYNAPRAASIQAKTDVILWSLDRECFNIIVKDAARKKRERYEVVLNQVRILDLLDPYEKSRLGDGIEDKQVQAGQTIFNQGDAADNFYIIAEGQIELYYANQGQAETRIAVLNSGDYFGEVELIRRNPRKVRAVAKTDSTLAYFNNDRFQRLFAPLFQEFGRQEQARYGRTF